MTLVVLVRLCFFNHTVLLCRALDAYIGTIITPLDLDLRTTEHLLI